MAATLKTREEKAFWAISKVKKLAQEGFYGQIVINIQNGNVVQVETRQSEMPPVDSGKV